MNNKIFFSIVGGLLLVGGILGILTFNTDSASAFLSKEEAKEKVQTQFPGEIVELELDKEGSKKVYEVEIKGTDRFYELEIDAKTGEVLKIEEKLFKNTANQSEQENAPEVKVNQDDDQDDKPASTKKETEKNNVVKVNDDRDDDKDDQKKQTNTTAKKEASSNSTPKVKVKKDDDDDDDKKAPKKQATKKSSIISKDKAKSIARGLFNGKIEEIELDSDDGLRYYEIEMYSSTEEAEIKINAYTGKLISISKEKHDDDDDDDDDD